jgi:ribosomal protein S18 acetylase RimI-like enzyme
MRERARTGFDEAVTSASEVSDPGTDDPQATSADRRALLAGIEECYDAMPRIAARTEPHGPFTLFVRTGDGWPYYARPRLGHRGRITVADVRAIRARQRELGVPEALEWVHDLTPSLLSSARAAGLKVRDHPLMAVTAAASRAVRAPAGVRLAAVRPGVGLARVLAVPQLAFAEPGSAVGTAGAEQRDAAGRKFDPRWLAVIDARLRAGTLAMSAAYDETGGPVAAGSFQTAGEFAEIFGVGTLPAYRRRGLGAALTAALVRAAAELGARTVFLSAGDSEVSRVYARIGFRTVGTAMVAAPG